MTKVNELLRVEAELTQLDSEIKYHKDEFNESIRGLTEKRKALQGNRTNLRDEVTENWHCYAQPVDGISLSYRKDFTVDASELDDRYFKTEPDIAKIKKELIESEWTKPIDGVTIIKKPSLRVSKKDL